MSDPYKKQTSDSLDDEKGELLEPTGKPEGERFKRRGDVDQSESTTKEAQPKHSSSHQAEAEQERQLATGEENAG